MNEADLLDAVRRLRREGCSPGEIARSLGVSRMAISPLIRRIADETSGDVCNAPIVGCWVSSGWSEELGVEGHPSWPRGDRAEGALGLASVVVAREHRTTRVSVCSYLLDTYCLGLKETIGPRIMGHEQLSIFNRAIFGCYDSPPLAAPIELAQHLVFGAVDYARGLGFEPAGDFRDCAGHLGSWSGPSAIRFGRRGKPMYVAGPYDDVDRVIETLERRVGNGNFDFLIGVPVLI